LKFKGAPGVVLELEDNGKTRGTLGGFFGDSEKRGPFQEGQKKKKCHSSAGGRTLIKRQAQTPQNGHLFSCRKRGTPPVPREDGGCNQCNRGRRVWASVCSGKKKGPENKTLPTPGGKRGGIGSRRPYLNSKGGGKLRVAVERRNQVSPGWPAGWWGQ